MNEMSTGREIPFDTKKLDDLLERAGIDALIVSSKHSLRYLLGGYRFFFFAHFDAIGLGRYVPMMVYQPGNAERTRYIGNGMERYEIENKMLWAPELVTAWSGEAGMKLAVEHLKKLGLGNKTIGIETGFLPADAAAVLHKELPDAKVVDALRPLERMRAVKSTEELEAVRIASDRVVDSMLAVIAGHGPGSTTRELTEALRREEVNRGLEFEYCLITTGLSHNRAPSERVWGEGDILTLDSGGNYEGYIGDLCRMAIHGEPDAELSDLLAEIDEIQMAARKPIRAGARGGDIFAAVEDIIKSSPNGNLLDFVAHGMGLISHEAPRLTTRAPVPYPADDAELPLQAGMVLSIETTLPHPKRGYIKLEDTVAVTADGWEGFGDQGRGWNRGGTAA